MWGSNCVKRSTLVIVPDCSQRNDLKTAWKIPKAFITSTMSLLAGNRHAERPTTNHVVFSFENINRATLKDKITEERIAVLCNDDLIGHITAGAVTMLDCAPMASSATNVLADDVKCSNLRFTVSGHYIYIYIQTEKDMSIWVGIYFCYIKKPLS